MILARLFLLVVLALAPTSAMAFTITFDSLNESPAGQHTEGLFTYDRVSGTAWEYSTVGNPGSSLITGIALPNIGDTFEFFLTGGGVFSLSSFDYAAGGFAQGDTVSFIESTGGIETTLCSITSTSPIFTTNSSCGIGSSMDHLLIRVTNASDVWLHFDNISLNGEGIPAPEPASMFLLGAGLFGVVARSRKSKA